MTITITIMIMTISQNEAGRLHGALVLLIQLAVVLRVLRVPDAEGVADLRKNNIADCYSKVEPRKRKHHGVLFRC